MFPQTTQRLVFMIFILLLQGTFTVSHREFRFQINGSASKGSSPGSSSTVLTKHWISFSSSSLIYSSPGKNDKRSTIKGFDIRPSSVTQKPISDQERVTVLSKRTRDGMSSTSSIRKQNPNNVIKGKVNMVDNRSTKAFSRNGLTEVDARTTGRKGTTSTKHSKSVRHKTLGSAKRKKAFSSRRNKLRRRKDSSNWRLSGSSRDNGNSNRLSFSDISRKSSNFDKETVSSTKNKISDRSSLTGKGKNKNVYDSDGYFDLGSELESYDPGLSDLPSKKNGQSDDSYSPLDQTTWDSDWETHAKTNDDLKLPEPYSTKNPHFDYSDNIDVNSNDASYYSGSSLQESDIRAKIVGAGIAGVICIIFAACFIAIQGVSKADMYRMKRKFIVVRQAMISTTNENGQEAARLITTTFEE